MTEQEKQKLKDALIEAKHIHPTEYDDEDAFVGICFSDLVDILNSVMRNTGWRHGSERPLPATGKKIIVYYKGPDGVHHAHTSFLNNLYEWFGVPESVGDNLMWCYPPEEE